MEASLPDKREALLLAEGFFVNHLVSKNTSELSEQEFKIIKDNMWKSVESRLTKDIMVDQKFTESYIKVIIKNIVSTRLLRPYRGKFDPYFGAASIGWFKTRRDAEFYSKRYMANYANHLEDSEIPFELCDTSASKERPIVWVHPQYYDCLEAHREKVREANSFKSKMARLMKNKENHNGLI